MGYNVTTETKNAFLANVVQDATITVNATDGTTTWNNSNIVQNSLTIDRYSVSSNDIEIGNVSSAELMLTLNNQNLDDVTIEGANLNVSISVNSSQVPLGVFTVDEVTRLGTLINIVALDYMVKFDKKIDVSNFSSSMTPNQILNVCCYDCNVTLGSVSDMLNTSITLDPTSIEGEDTTYRDLIMWVAQITGTNAYIDYQGYLTLSCYAIGTPTDNIDVTNYIDCDMQGYEVEVTGVEVISGDDKYITGTDGYVISIENNELITSTNVNTILGNLNSRLVGFAYQPWSASTLPMPWIWPMDRVNLTKKNESTVNTIVTNCNYRLNANNQFAGRGESPRSKGYARVAPMTQAQRTVIKALEQRTSDKIDEAIQDSVAFNELVSNALGLFATAVEQTDGSFIYYLHNKPTLAESNEQWRMASGVFSVSTDGGTTWNAGFTAGGEAVLQALMTGILRSPGKTSATDNVMGFYADATTNNATFGIGSMSGNHITYDGANIDIETDWLDFDSDTQTVILGDTINQQTKIGNSSIVMEAGIFPPPYSETPTIGAALESSMDGLSLTARLDLGPVGQRVTSRMTQRGMTDIVAEKFLLDYSGGIPSDTITFYSQFGGTTERNNWSKRVLDLDQGFVLSAKWGSEDEWHDNFKVGWSGKITSALREGHNFGGTTVNFGEQYTGQVSFWGNTVNKVGIAVTNTQDNKQYAILGRSDHFAMYDYSADAEVFRISPPKLLKNGDNWGSSSSVSISSRTSNTWTSVGGIELPAGTYLVVASADWSTNATGQRKISLNTTPNSSPSWGFVYLDYRNAVSGDYTTNRIVASVRLTATTTVYMNVWQNSGSSLTIYPRASIFKLA